MNNNCTFILTAKRELAKKERDESIIHEREGLKKERKQKLNKRAGKKYEPNVGPKTKV